MARGLLVLPPFVAARRALEDPGLGLIGPARLAEHPVRLRVPALRTFLVGGRERRLDLPLDDGHGAADRLLLADLLRRAERDLRAARRAPPHPGGLVRPHQPLALGTEHFASKTERRY